MLWQWGFQSNPFGEQSPTASAGYVFNLRFPGQYADAESGLVHNGFRDYCAACGRYIQSDPIGLEGGLSTYGYVSSNPLTSFDLLGTEQKSPAVLLALVPGQGAWDAAVNSYQAGHYGWAATYAGAMLSEQILYVASFGQSQALRTGAVCTTTAAKELTADEIRAINQSFGGSTELTGSADTVIANMAYREGAQEQAATAIRDIAGRHLFDDGNKRTAQAVAERILGPSADAAKIRSVIDQVGNGTLRSVEDISAALGK